MIQIAFAFFKKLQSKRSFGNACHSSVPTLLPRLEKVVWGGGMEMIGGIRML